MTEKLTNTFNENEGYDDAVARLKAEIIKAQQDIESLKTDTNFPLAVREHVMKDLNTLMDKKNGELLELIRESEKIVPNKEIENTFEVADMDGSERKNLLNRMGRQ